MSTIPLLEGNTPGLFAVGGPMCEIGRTSIETVVEELVAAMRGLERVRAQRTRATELLADVDGTLARAREREAAARDAFETYLRARVDGPIR